MGQFAFRAVDLAGVPSRGEVEAATKAHVTEQLRQRGLIVLDVSEKREAFKLESIFQRFKKVGMRELSVFSRQFATLISSGMPMLRSLYTLEDQTEDEMLKRSIVALRQDVEAGSSVAQAMESQPGVFDPLYRSMVHAGEGSGRLEEALDRVAVQLERLDALRRQVKSAMMYPSVVLGLAALVMIAVVAFIVPVFVGIFEEIAADQPGESAELPFMTQITVGVSGFITGKWFILFPTIALAVYAFIRWKNTERGRMQWDRFKLRIPWHIGDVVHKVALARWSRTLSALTTAGVPLMQALEITGKTAGNWQVEKAMDEVITSVRSGGTIAAPLKESPIFPSMVTHMLGVGEETGALDTMLTKIADFYEDQVNAAVKQLTSILEPVMIVIVGGMVGFIVISMYLPLFKVYDQIK